MESRMGLPDGYSELVARYVRYVKMMEAIGGHTEFVTEPADIHPALERAYAASQDGRPSCVNVITDPMEQMITRSNRASALIGY